MDSFQVKLAYSIRIFKDGFGSKDGDDGVSCVEMVSMLNFNLLEQKSAVSRKLRNGNGTVLSNRGQEKNVENFFLARKSTRI